jgi:SAM-dependent methyltransferase
MCKGQEELEKHWGKIYLHQAMDFRSSNIALLVARLVESGSVLDIGCGTGHLSLTLLQRSLDVFAQDKSPEMVNRCKEVFIQGGYDPGRVRLASVEDLDEQDYYDNVVALDVIEHIENDLMAVRAMCRVLKPGGKLILSVPSISWLYGPKDEQVGHYRRYEKKMLAEIISKSGLKLTDIRYWNIIGVLPLCLSVKILKRKISEDFRYRGEKSTKSLVLNSFLRNWFFFIENSLPMPLGLTLIASARKPK